MNEATIANLLILIWQLYLDVSFEPPQKVGVDGIPQNTRTSI